MNKKQIAEEVLACVLFVLGVVLVVVLACV